MQDKYNPSSFTLNCFAAFAIVLCSILLYIFLFLPEPCLRMVLLGLAIFAFFSETLILLSSIKAHEMQNTSTGIALIIATASFISVLLVGAVFGLIGLASISYERLKNLVDAFIFACISMHGIIVYKLLQESYKEEE